MTPTTLFKCLSDKTRLYATLLISEEQELCVCELVEALQLNQPKVSRHLAQLKSCNILLDRRQDQWVFYRINPELPDWANNIVQQAIDSCSAELNALKANLNTMDCRPERCC